MFVTTDEAQVSRHLWRSSKRYTDEREFNGRRDELGVRAVRQQRSVEQRPDESRVCCRCQSVSRQTDGPNGRLQTDADQRHSHLAFSCL